MVALPLSVGKIRHGNRLIAILYKHPLTVAAEVRSCECTGWLGSAETTTVPKPGIVLVLYRVLRCA